MLSLGSLLLDFLSKSEIKFSWREQRSDWARRAIWLLELQVVSAFNSGDLSNQLAIVAVVGVHLDVQMTPVSRGLGEWPRAAWTSGKGLSVPSTLKSISSEEGLCFSRVLKRS